jgi:glycosyltransferase involved in cell wall biosynthesis
MDVKNTRNAILETMSHIVIDARIINSSTGTYIERLLHYLQQIDKVNTYTVLLRAKDKDYWEPTSDNFTVKIADFANYSIGEQTSLKKLLDSLSPDLVHFCMPQQPVLYRGNHVTTFHDLTLLKTYNSDKNWVIYHIKQFFGRFVFRYAALSSNQIIVPSEFTKKELLRYFNISPKKIVITPLAADTCDDTITTYKQPFKHFILYVGQQSDYKNIRRLGYAHQKLLETRPNLGLILVGNLNASAQINQKYFNENKYKNIIFTDFIPNNQRDWLYANTDAYIFPSLMEGFGLPGLEAMGHGAPVVSSNATCLPEVYGNAAYYFDPNSTDDMAQAIKDVLTNDKLRNDLIERGYQQIKKYSWQHTALKTHEVYTKALRA